MVFPPPTLNDLLGLGQCREPMYIQTLRSQRAVERLYVRVVRRLTLPREVDLHLAVIRPQIHDLTRELRAVITEQQLRRPSFLSDLIQSTHHVFSSQPLSHFDGKAFPRK